ncbi:S-layer homology domain-containing protein [Geosporobacter subterraneus DSM 17957]|uniref:S-layer homology domain-containing protein n=1 Tax=Geosporobacter subterraneus DSM 17957 TaxID=1121919 RepID=A0A1M6C1A2_9FIRM|nr:S-layer homology domain-containing protein [Geosporobacter subterraneus]SHI54796.1 S-layer homology domain-containing protein [Geosporobacter subterraneus DSM 17957]
MKLTRRERTLVTLLGVVVFLWGYYQFLITPQLLWVEGLKQENQKMKAEMTRLENAAAVEKQLDDSIFETNEQIRKITGKYFTDTEQEEFILLFNEFFQDPSFKVLNIAFTPPAMEKLGEIEIEASSINLSYEGSYPALMNHLQTFWKFQKKIIVKNINMTSKEDGSLTGNIQLSFYRLQNSPDLKDDLFRWYIDEDFFKENPFSAMAPQGGLKINYLFIGGDPTKLVNATYKPFADIAGHWAQTEINDFGSKFYVRGDLENNFKPDEPMSRGEFVIMLDKIYQWPMPESQIDLTKFEDYGTLGSYENSMAKAIFKGYLGGYVAGYQDNTLRPRAPITYEEVEFIMGSVLSKPDFSWNEMGQKLLVEKNIVSNGLENKNAYLTRAEAVYLLYHTK